MSSCKRSASPADDQRLPTKTSRVSRTQHPGRQSEPVSHANARVPSHAFLNGNQEEENTMDKSNNSIKEHSTMSVHDTPAFKNLRVLMEFLTNGNDEWCSDHITLRNPYISVQKGEEALNPDPVPVYDVNGSRRPSSMRSDSDTNEMDIAEEYEFTTDIEQFVSTVNGEQCTDEVDGICTPIGPSMKTEESLDFRKECEVALRSSSLNIFLRVLESRRLRMETIPGGLPPAECRFKRRVYWDKVSGSMVCCFLSVKCSAYMQVTKDRSLIVGDDQAHDRDPKPCEQFILCVKRNAHQMCHDTENGRKYLDYDKNTSNTAVLSNNPDARFHTITL